MKARSAEARSSRPARDQISAQSPGAIDHPTPVSPSPNTAFGSDSRTHTGRCLVSTPRVSPRPLCVVTLFASAPGRLGPDPPPPSPASLPSADAPSAPRPLQYPLSPQSSSPAHATCGDVSHDQTFPASPGPGARGWSPGRSSPDPRSAPGAGADPEAPAERRKLLG